MDKRYRKGCLTASPLGLDDEGVESRSLLQDLDEVALRIAEVCLRSKSVLDDRQFVVERSCLGFIRDAPEVVLSCMAHDHHLPLAAVERDPSEHRVAVTLADLAALVFLSALDENLVSVGNTSHHLG